MFAENTRSVACALRYTLANLYVD